MKVSVSVVTHQSAPWIDACLDAVEAQAFVHEVLVVDSASTDDTVARIEARRPRVDLDAAATNLGFGAGHNRNWARASGDALLVLNPDVVLAPGALAALVDVLDARPEVAAAVPRLVSMSDPKRLDSAGIRWSPGRTRFVWRPKCCKMPATTAAPSCSSPTFSATALPARSKTGSWTATSPSFP